MHKTMASRVRLALPVLWWERRELAGGLARRPPLELHRGKRVAGASAWTCVKGLVAVGASTKETKTEVLRRQVRRWSPPELHGGQPRLLPRPSAARALEALLRGRTLGCRGISSC